MKKHLIALSVIGSCISFGASANWTLAYHHDKHGNALKGQLCQLVDAVEAGQEVRVLQDSGSSKALTTAEYVYTKGGKVFAELTSNISASFHGDKLHHQQNAYHWFATVDTSGYRHMARWNVGEHVNRGYNSDQVEIKWFVNTDKPLGIFNSTCNGDGDNDPSTPDLTKVPEWSKTQEYKGGEVVKFANKYYYARHWTRGQEPVDSASGPWTELKF
ncbi:putative Carbohydrate-binding family V/XII protein [Vibrio nigripulchritudo SFn27]|uniref:Putative Carbohydrate-binding family V/XII protein n=1 Tax=Vibrio nigripulchritudo TaxID=28173 RepID=U4K5V6_9VIBR|nr:carbohydrate-binding protein [Vibrio nigripulchritudo]CCN83423.1 putative Carbohydrate-binding family V/XII protein [Vibrio nigripulchritudo BLFn1]CCN88782.1 putative Carbohydrate-binding family V/XII protein [Vibrio nigripulchritudo SFn27]CCN94989.1 putative Carbohydrate-binding family V/XII protein [Vibrio nigripulchritudo ENn2]CCO41127.1 putative Carbohydrate-binding family V/XII protein [Vibrio nigripulchritudo SFn135]CCO52444.1 putative Carbohydrate-binding family V/XII protein [Vibrio